MGIFLLIIFVLGIPALLMAAYFIMKWADHKWPDDPQASKRWPRDLNE